MVAFVAFWISVVTGAIADPSDVIYIGDSHSVGCFGERIDRALRLLQDQKSFKPLKIQSVATCGSSAASWLKSEGHSTNCGFRSCDSQNVCRNHAQGHAEPLDRILSQNAPVLTVVALGTNMLKIPLARGLRDVNAVIDEVLVHGSRCVWIGPPQASVSFISEKNFSDFAQALQREVEKRGCWFIRSDNKTARESITDPMGLHYRCKEARVWAESVVREFPF